MSTKPTFFTRYKLPPRNDYHSDKPSMTEQSFAYECDINNLVRTAVDKNGRQHTIVSDLASSLPPNTYSPQFGDFTTYTSEKLLEAKNLVSKAQAEFELLPSHIRDRFSNDPVKLITFVNDDKNYDEAVKLGICKKRVEVSKDVADVQPLPSQPIQPVKVNGETPST